MPLKDYYTTLQVSATATPAEIKKAYRMLAFKYHPDKNPESAFAEGHFKEIQEAYATLSHSGKRKQYDEERWLTGMYEESRNKKVINGAWMLRQSVLLRQYVQARHADKISTHNLYEYINELLSDRHMHLLGQEQQAAQQHAILKELLATTKYMKPEYVSRLTERYNVLAQGNEHLLQTIQQQLQESTQRAWWDAYLPYIVAAVTVILCIFMYWYGNS
jgi:curved DNA-binding protein CbpA